MADFFRSELSFTCPPDQYGEFTTFLLELNYKRVKMFSILLVGISIVLSIPSDIIYIADGGWRNESAFSGMLILDSLTLLICLMFWFLFHWNTPKADCQYNAGHRWLLRLFLAFVILFAVGASLIDQKISGSLTFYFVCVIAIAGVVVLEKDERRFIFGGSLILQLMTLYFVQPSTRSYLTQGIGAAEMTIVSLVISTLIFVQKSKEFVRNRLIQNQQKEILKSNRRLAQANLGLYQMNDLKDTLIGIATRDLKTPLMSISGYAETWKGDAEPNSGLAKSGAAISTLVVRALDTTTSLLERAMKTISNFGAEQNPIDLSEVTAATMFLLTGQVAEKGHVLKSNLEDNCIVLGEREWASQIVEHLLTSAILTAKPETRIDVIVKRSQTSGNICLTLSHSQRLLSDAEVLQVFEDPSASFTSSNTKGIGFWLVKQYVEAMKGTIRCENDTDGGTTFLVEFPPFPQESLPKT